jgi:hypothetical protein
LSHAVLGAALAVANNSSAVGGALAGGGGELAAQILTKELYPQAFDANGNLQRDKLTPEQANNVTALSSAIGALLSGAAGGSTHDAAIGGQVATNAVENNFLLRPQADAKRNELKACNDKRGRCSGEELNAIREKYLAIEKSNDALMTSCIQSGNKACVAELERQAVLNDDGYLLGRAAAAPLNKPERIEVVMSGNVQLGQAFKTLNGFSLGVQEEEDSFLHNQYPARPGIGVMFNEYTPRNGKTEFLTRYGVLSNAISSDGGYFLREASKEEIDLMSATLRSEALTIGADAKKIGILSYAFAAGGPLLANGLKAASSRVIDRVGYNMDVNKFEYFFGKVEAPAQDLKVSNPKLYEQLNHNYQRSQQLKSVFEANGFSDNLAGRERMLSLFEQAAKGEEVARFVGEKGTTVTRRIDTPTVKYEVKFYYEGGNMNGVPKISTVIPKVKTGSK